MRGLVVERAVVALRAGEEVGGAHRVEIDADRDLDIRHRRLQRIDVLVPVAEIDDADAVAAPFGAFARPSKSAITSFSEA